MVQSHPLLYFTQVVTQHLRHNRLSLVIFALKLFTVALFCSQVLLQFYFLLKFAYLCLNFRLFDFI